MTESKRNLRKLETILGRIVALQGWMPKSMKLQEAARLIRRVMEEIEGE
ncbi:MAG TPA: hypothetical protein VGO47_05340 [Chlamydiales bacterium]|jgi:hypothetical protein|nr:hypothetical protein [Chlamydiales bacterium]